jgi:hypothetical protein
LVRYLSIINHRTLITVFLSLIIPFSAYEFKIIYNIDLTLISLAIIFPLVFAIRGAFKRREKALEHLSLFRGSLKTIEYFFMNSTKLSDDSKNDAKLLLIQLSDTFLNYLSKDDNNSKEIDKKTESLIDFIIAHSDEIPGGVKQKVFRFMRDLHVAQEKLISIHTHRTPISLKAYCLIFIYLFPVIYTPTIINKIGIENPQGLTYFIVLLSEFILISLYNIQDQMEYPFDRDGLDDIKLDNYKINRLID